MGLTPVQKLRLRKRLAQTCDRTIWILLGALALLAVVGGVDLTGLGIPFSAHGLGRLGLAVAVVLCARTFIDSGTAIRETPLLRKLSEIVEDGRFRSSRFVWVSVGIFVCVMLAAAWARHATFRSNAYDLGLFENLLWNTSHGRWFHSDVLGRSFWGEHFSPILFPVAFIHRVLPHPLTLLALQTVALAAGAFPLARLARRELKHEGLAHAVVVAYLAYLPLRNVAMFDFHPVVFATPLLIEAFASFREERFKRGLVACLVALLAKESVALPVAALGVYVAFVLQRRALGIGLALFAVALLAFVVGWLVPSVRGEAYPFLNRYQALYEGRLFELMSGQRLMTLFLIFGPVLFMPLFSPTHLALALPSLAANLLSTDPHQHQITYQYTATVTPMVFVATVMGIARLERSDGLRVTMTYYATPRVYRPYIAGLLLLASALFFGRSPITDIRAGWDGRSDLRAVLREIPDQVAVSAQGNLLPHMARRADVGMFPDRLAEWVVLDRQGIPYPWHKRKEVREWVDRLGQDPSCETVRDQQRAVLFRCDARQLEGLIARSGS